MGEHVGEGLSHKPLREGIPLPLHVGGIRHEGQDARLAVAGERDEVGKLAVHRGLVELEVTGVNHHPLGSADRQGAAVHDGVGDPDEFDFERAGSNLFPRFHHPQVHHLVEVVFLELFPDEAERQGGAVDGWGNVLQNEGERADMVLVAMGQKYPAHPVDLVAQIGNIGDDQIDAEHVRLGKHQAAVDDDDVLAILEDGHVQADLPEPAEGDEPETGIVVLSCFFHRDMSFPLTFVARPGPGLSPTRQSCRRIGQSIPCRGQ